MRLFLGVAIKYAKVKGPNLPANMSNIKINKLAGCNSPVIPRDKPTVQAAETASKSKSKKMMIRF